MIMGKPYSVTGIGISDAAKIALRSLTTYLWSTAQYADARASSIEAAEDLFGACSQQAKSTAAAWSAVGVAGTYNCTPSSAAEFYQADCSDDNGATIPSSCSNYWSYTEEHGNFNLSNMSANGMDKWLPDAWNRLYTTVHNRGGNGSNPDERTAWVFAYWHEGASGLEWPADGNPAKYKIYNDQVGYGLGLAGYSDFKESNFPIEVASGESKLVEWYWFAPKESDLEPWTDHICVGFVVNPLSPEPQGPTAAIDPANGDRRPLYDDNIAQINLAHITRNLTGKVPIDSAFRWTVAARNNTNSTTLIAPRYTAGSLPAGWSVSITPTAAQPVLKDSFYLVNIALIPPPTAHHGDTAVVDFYTFNMTDTSRVMGGVRLRARIDNFPPDTGIVLKGLCPPEDLGCCPPWMAPICGPLGPHSPMEWTMPVLDANHKLEKLWFFIVCRDTLPSVDLTHQLDSVAVDFDLNTAGFQWVDATVDSTKRYYYRVYAVDEAGNISGGSNVISVNVAEAYYPMGDCDGDYLVNISDVIALIGYIFNGVPLKGYSSCDASCDHTLNISDAVWLITYIFAGGPEPGLNCFPTGGK